MSHRLGRLTALEMTKTRTPGRYADGGGLYLQVTSAGADDRGRERVTKSWLYRYMLRGKANWMGLGSVDDVSLAQARERAEACRRQRNAGIDPIEARETEKRSALLEAAKAMTFDQCRDAFIEAHKAAWRNLKHRDQWTNTLQTYATPVFGCLSVQAADTGLVLKVLEPIWATKPETAGRVRGRIETVLDWATARGYRQGPNPARWRGHLDQLLPKRSKLRRVRHHPALPFGQLPEFLRAVQQHKGLAALGLEFLILTAARTGEVIGARPEEINIVERIWTVPPERMKAGRGHRVPLCERAVKIVETLTQEHPGEFLFPGAKRGQPLSNMAMLELVRGMSQADGKPWTDAQGSQVVPHGFRSSFRDWAAERTDFPAQLIEMALAHIIADKTEAAYRRGDLLEKRRRLMDAWAGYCSSAKPSRGASATVVGLRAQRGN
jgi:integrase